MEMWKPGIVTLILFLGAAGAGHAAGGVDCVKTQCEGTGRQCVETLYVAYEACMKAGNKKCNSVQPAEKFNCLRAELTPCALTRNDQQTACYENVRTCYATCGPFESERIGYWCVADYADMTTAAFCEANPADARPMDQCDKTMSAKGSFSAMTCEPL